MIQQKKIALIIVVLPAPFAEPVSKFSPLISVVPSYDKSISVKLFPKDKKFRSDSFRKRNGVLIVHSIFELMLLY